MDQSAGVATREGAETTRAGHHNTASGHGATAWKPEDQCESNSGMHPSII